MWSNNKNKSHVIWLSYILYDPGLLQCNLYYCIDHLKEILAHLMQEEETVDRDVIKVSAFFNEEESSQQRMVVIWRSRDANELFNLLR
ncbi:hypothetical protein H5410_020470 [Solanum commersonii]|uniref:Uncharacterized protein n=1 Tax=Solanum commersonii TaxID=4109 RepID=A0A9J5ZA37_SOLCO|nr:hypothetical protein H5410_020470 [Solanum commersonii]